MAVRGEEVASSIEAHVRESVEKMVEEIRSSIEDVRVAVDSQLKAALQSVQADVNALNFLPHIQKSVGGLEEELQSALPAAAPSGASTAVLKDAGRALESAKSQVDILNALLDQSLRFGSRAALLIVRGEMFGGWKGAGFSAHGGNDEMVKRFNATPGLIPELDEVLRSEHCVAWDGVNIATRLGMATSERAIAIPMVIKDKVAAALYVDAVGDDVAKLDVAALQFLVFVTGLLIDTLAIRKKSPSPTFAGGDAPTQAAPPPRPATATPAPRPAAAAPRPAAPPPAPPPAPTPAPPPPAQRGPATDSGTVAISSAQLREMMAAQRPNFNVPAADEFSGATTKVPAVEAKTTAPSPVAPPAGEDRPSTQYVPPPNLARGSAAGPQNDDMKKHDEARRFARLLVSEIKLYNEAKVDQGRKNNDLYERLKEDIDRSRQMYDERIDDGVRKTSNYFYDELVRILAEGRAEALGL